MKHASQSSFQSFRDPFFQDLVFFVRMVCVRTQRDPLFPDLVFSARMPFIRAEKTRPQAQRASKVKSCTDDESVRAGRGLHAEDEAIRMQTTTFVKPRTAHFAIRFLKAIGNRVSKTSSFLYGWCVSVHNATRFSQTSSFLHGCRLSVQKRRGRKRSARAKSKAARTVNLSVRVVV